MQQHLNRDCILHNWSQLSSKYCNFIFFLSFHPTNERSALPEDICPRILLTFCYRHHMQFHCWVFTATENKNLELRQKDSLDHQFITVVKKIHTLVNEKYIMFSRHPRPIQILKKVTWNVSTTIFCQIFQCRHNIQGYSKWMSGYNCRAAIPHQIRETTAIWQFHSMAACTVSRDRVRVYPGTEGTNQNCHWNNHRRHAERTRLSCWYLWNHKGCTCRAPVRYVTKTWECCSIK